MSRTSLILVITTAASLAVGCNRSSKRDIPVSASGGGTSTPSSSPDSAAVPIIGGTLTIAANGRAVVSDPDRDRVIFANLKQRRVVAKRALGAGAFPGRAVIDDGDVFVVLRGEGEVLRASIDGDLRGTFAVCPNPRGIAARSATKEILVACAEGELRVYDRTGGLRGGAVVAPDLRDVVVTANDEIFVTTFRDATVLRLGSELEIEEELRAPGSSDITGSALEPRVMWDLVEAPDGRLVGLHQHAASRELVPGAAGVASPSYYGASGLPVVETVVTSYGDAGAEESAPSPSEVLTVDADVEPESGSVLTVSAGSYSYSVRGPFGQSQNPVEAQPIAGAFFDGDVVIQTREPSELVILRDGMVVDQIKMGGDDVTSLGHAIFHATPEGPAVAVTCASCHPEGREDGHTWNFGGVGLRRTQTLLGGVMDGAPFHWSGDIDDLDHLMDEVFTVRMGNRELASKEVEAFGAWLGELPNLREPKADDAGRAVFEAAGCATCHSGPRFTDETNRDVGTGEAFQTPSLVGVRFRAPYMHDGCAETLEERFDPACGGDAHGDVEDLSEDELGLLVEYLRSL